MRTKQLFLGGMMACAIFVSCDDKHPSFHNSAEAVEGCKKVLAEMHERKEVDTEELARLTANWLETQDSAYSVFSKDSTINLKSPVALAYFIISDSIRHEIGRLAFSKPRTLKDVMFLKLNTANERNKVEGSETYKEAVKFYEALDEHGTYPSLSTTLSMYYRLLNSVKTFKKEQQLVSFITEEDKCFRSLMGNLSNVRNEDLQKLTAATARIFDNLYSSVGKKADEVNDRTMLYLTMRFNRRIIQNALACKNDINDNKRLESVQKANYKWMLIQPYMAIDDYSTAVLTDKQREDLLDLASELPSLLGKLDEQKQDKDSEKKLTEILSGYFLKTYLSTNL